MGDDGNARAAMLEGLMKTLESEVSSLKTQLTQKDEQLKLANEQAQIQGDKSKARMKDAREAIEAWQKENETLTSQIDTLKEELQKQASATVGVTDGDGGAAAERANMLEGLMKTLEGEVKSLKEQKVEYETKISDMEASIQEKENQVEEQATYMKKKMSQAKDVIEEWKLENSKLTKQIDELKANGGSTTPGATVRKKKDDGEEMTIEEELEDAKNEIKNLTDMLTATEKRAVRLEGQVKDDKKQISNLESKVKEVATSSSPKAMKGDNGEDQALLIKQLQTENELLSKLKNQAESNATTMKRITMSVVIVCMAVTTYAYKDQLPKEITSLFS